MITIDALKRFGADTEEGLARCMGMEDFYLQLVGTMLEDANFAKLDEAVEAKDAKSAFEAAHALKGALGNLSLTPVCKPVEEITEKLRGQESMPDISDLFVQYKGALQDLKSLL
jgi:HPt (histidine-containing phosphotransfer) domain-containing protein